jgi:hypothetical protein
MALLIGIDTGVHTGVATFNTATSTLDHVATTTITRAMSYIATLNTAEVVLFIEDARLRHWFGNTGRERLRGAGSVCRDSQIWETFAKENNIRHYLIAPRHNKTKLTATQFNCITGYKGRTTEHARDAAMLVWQKTLPR